MSDQEALLPLKQAYEEFEDIIAALSDETFLSPMDKWTPRDVVAHLIGWNFHMVEAAKSILMGREPDYYKDAANDYSNMNARFTAQYSSRSRDKMLEELKSSLDGFEVFLLALPPAELVADQRVRHYSGSLATVGKLITSLTSDYVHHARQIREWLGSK